MACSDSTLWSDGEYEVIWLDKPSYLAKCSSKLNMCKGLTGEPILCIGNDSRYIVAEFYNKKNNESTFYIIDKNIRGFNSSTDLPMSVDGPYKKEQFEIKVKELDLPDFSESFNSTLKVL
tara:strand:+ start:3074 stop:3433 length:360 start_codon:yes stop_codon:yes gene_type:complete